jgi:hypothetical protein
MNGNFVSLQYLIDRIKRHPMLTGLDFDVAVRDAVDCMKLIGSKKILTEKFVRIPIVDYRGTLPLDIYKINQVRRVLITPLSVTSENTTEKDRESYQPLVAATDTFHKVYNKTNLNNAPNINDTYETNDYYIFTAFETGTIDIAYEGIATDTDGYPLIPDEVNVVKALELYIKVQYFTVLSDLGKIDRYTLDKAEQEYAWYVGKAQSATAMVSEDERQAIANIMNMMFLEPKKHDEFFRTLSTQERLRIKN